MAKQPISYQRVIDTLARGESIQQILYHHYPEGNSRWDLSGYDLHGQDLRDVSLPLANLSGANLSGCDLRWADLWDADLSGCDLTGADLTGVSMARANLSGAKLTGVDFTAAGLDDVKLDGATLPDPKVRLPPVGTDFKAYKKVKVCSAYGSAYGDHWPVAILELLIPTTADRVSSLVGKKCRASSAIVLSATDPDRKPILGLSQGHNLLVSFHDPNFRYTVGEKTKDTGFDGDIRVECTRGIHFFATREEAVAYRY